MDFPMEVYTIISPDYNYPELRTLKAEMMSRFPSVQIHQITYNQLFKTITAVHPNPNWVYLLLTHNITPSQEMQRVLLQIEASGAGLIMYPTPASMNPAHLVARTPQEIITNLGMINRRIRGTYAPTRQLGVSRVGTVTGSTADLNLPALLGVNIFKSNNEIFTRDMNTLYQSYRNDRRVKFNQVTSLQRVPAIIGGRHLVFVADTDAVNFVHQLQMVQGRPDRFFPVLYNTSRMPMPTGPYFTLAVSDLNRATTQINAYLANSAYGGSMTTITNQISPLSPVSKVGLNATTFGGQTLAGPHTRLIVLDNGNPGFQQFYNRLPIDYLLIPLLQPNAVFKEPTILLAPIEAQEHVLTHISPEATNVRCVFYSLSPGFQSVNNRFVSLVSSNNIQIQNFLRSSGVQFLQMNTITTNTATFHPGQSAFMRENTVINNNLAQSLVRGNQSVWEANPHYAYQWTIKRRPNTQRHVTFLSAEEQLHMNRSTNTRLIGSTESRQDFEINSIPNQSQMRFGSGKISLGSPPKNTYMSELNNVVTQTVVIPPLKPVAHTSRVVEEIYEETIIGAKQRAPSNFHNQASNYTVTVDQIPIQATVQNLDTFQIFQPPPPRNFMLSQPSELQMRIQPQVISQAPVFVEPVKQIIVIPPVHVPTPPPIIVQVPPITSGYNTSTLTTNTIPVHHHHHTTNVITYTPPKIIPTTTTTNINVSRKILEPEWVDPIKYQKTMQNGKVIYVMRQEYKNRLIEDAISKPVYNEVDYIVDSPRIARSRAYNDIDYVMDSPRAKRSRVVIQDVLPTTVYNPMTFFPQTTQIQQTLFTSPALDQTNYETRMQNGVKVYYKRSGVSPYRRSDSPMYVDQYNTSPTVVINQPQVFRRSVVIQDRLPTRQVVQSPQVIQLRRSNAGQRGSRVYRASRAGDSFTRYQGGNQPVHVVFKKLNNLLVNTSQYFKDPRYRTHKYYSTNQLATIASSIPHHQPVILVVDDVPDQMDYFNRHASFNTVVIPKGKSYRTQQSMYPKYKWIYNDDPEFVAEQIIAHIDQRVYGRPNNGYPRSRAIQDVQFLSPNNYNTYNTPSANIKNNYRARPNNSSKKVLLFPIQRSEVKDFVQSRLPSTFEFVPYNSMDQLVRELEYWPSQNLVVILGQPLAQQIGTVKRMSRNAQYIIYDPDNMNGYSKQDYNAIKRVRTVHDLIPQLQAIVGTNTRYDQFRRENRSFHY